MYKEKFNSDNIDYDIIVGRNSKENWNLIDFADGKDLWFHVDDKPSCHVFIKIIPNTDRIPRDVIIRAAQLCKEYSKYKNDKKVKIIYTTINNIMKAKDIGSVHILNHKKLENITI